MIRSSSCAKTEKLFYRERVRDFAAIGDQARRRLVLLNNARELRDLFTPASNRLERLSEKDRRGQGSIRINDQYRLCFTWKEDGAYEVEITKHYR